MPGRAAEQRDPFLRVNTEPNHRNSWWLSTGSSPLTADRFRYPPPYMGGKWEQARPEEQNKSLIRQCQVTSHTKYQDLTGNHGRNSQKKVPKTDQIITSRSELLDENFKTVLCKLNQIQRLGSIRKNLIQLLSNSVCNRNVRRIKFVIREITIVSFSVGQRPYCFCDITNTSTYSHRIQHWANYIAPSPRFEVDGSWGCGKWLIASQA